MAAPYSFEWQADLSALDGDTSTEIPPNPGDPLLFPTLASTTLAGRSFELSGTYYLSPVENTDAPLAERDFLQRASRIRLGRDSESTGTKRTEVYRPPIFGLGSRLTSNYESDSENYALGGRFIHAPSGLYAFASADRPSGDLEIAEPRTAGSDRSKGWGFRVGAGMYLLQYTTVDASYSRRHLKDRAALSSTCTPIDPFCFPIKIGAVGETDMDFWNGHIRHFGNLRSWS